MRRKEFKVHNNYETQSAPPSNERALLSVAMQKIKICVFLIYFKYSWIWWLLEELCSSVVFQLCPPLAEGGTAAAPMVVLVKLAFVMSVSCTHSSNGSRSTCSSSASTCVHNCFAPYYIQLYHLL